MLFKNVIRTLKKQYVQLLLLGIIITLSSFVYTTMDYGVGSILTSTEKYFEIANQEDFAISMLDIILEEDATYITNNCNVTTNVFTISSLKTIDETCYYGVINNRLQTIENEYDGINLELRESKDVYFDYNNTSYKIRFLKETTEINKSYFVKGKAPINDSEIAISEAFANSNSLNVGDIIKINGKDYTISGYVLFADYSLPLFSNNLIIDNKSQSIGLLINQEFENLDEYVKFAVAGVFTSDDAETNFETNVIDNYQHNDSLPFVTNIVLTHNNMRSGAIYGEIEGGQAMGLVISLGIASIAILIVSIMVSKILHSQRGAIGILKSMGYSNTQITIPYIFFIVILSFPAIILGYYLGSLAALPMSNIVRSFYLLPTVVINQSLKTFFVAVIVPFSFLVIVSYFIITKLLNKKPVELLNPELASDTNFLIKIVMKYLKRLKVSTKIKHLLLYRNTMKFLAFVFGMFFAAFLILFSLSMVNIFDKLTVDYYQNTDHNYIGYCDYVVPCDSPVGSQEKIIELPSAILGDEEIYLVGLNPDSSIHKLVDKKDNVITEDLNEGIVITKSLSFLKGFKVGDKLLLEIGDKQQEVEVIGITEEYNGNKAYINRATLSELLTGNSDYYNVVYSKTVLNKDHYMVVVSTEKILEQSQIMQGLFEAMFRIMMVASFVIGAIVVYILTVMTIEDNFYNISLFKVIGYNDKEIDKMVLGGYMIYGIAIFLVAIPVSITMFYLMTVMFARYYDIVFPLDFQYWHIFVSVGMFITIFNVGAFVAKKKLEKVSLQEAMKMYQN